MKNIFDLRRNELSIFCRVIAIAVMCILLSSCAETSMFRYPPVRWVADNDSALIERPKGRVGKAARQGTGIDADVSEHVHDVMVFTDELAQLPKTALYAGQEEALNVNNFDETADSTWFTNRLGRYDMSAQDVANGQEIPSPPDGKWKVLAVNPAGYTFAVLASLNGMRFIISFDTSLSGETRSAGEIMASLILYAAGYNVTQKDLSYFSKTDFVAGDTDMNMALDELFAILKPDTKGIYRATITKLPNGEVLGPTTFIKKRSSDTNDRIPHEYRRELRALRIFAAFLNDTGAGPSGMADIFIKTSGQKGFVKHFIIRPEMNIEDAVAVGDTRRQMHALNASFSFGFYNPYWTSADNITKPKIIIVPDLLDAHGFDPKEWNASESNAAFRLLTRRDAFWAARIISRLSDDMLGAIVMAARFSNPSVAERILGDLKARRDKIRTYGLSQLTAADNFDVAPSDGGFTLSFDDLNQEGNYQFRVKQFKGRVRLTDWIAADSPKLAIPETATESIKQSGIFEVEIQSKTAAAKWWSPPIHVYLKRNPDGMQIIGLRRY